MLLTHAPDFEHGTLEQYALGDCRCRPCAKAKTDHSARTAGIKADFGLTTYVDAAAVRAHVFTLIADDFDERQIAKLAGVSTTAVDRLLHRFGYRPPTQRMHRDTAARLLAVSPGHERRDLVDATGTRRMLQSLTTRGFPKHLLAARVGTSERGLTELLHCTVPISAVIARKAAGTYAELHNADPAAYGITDAAAAVVRTNAARHGFHPPEAWAPGTINDPNAAPIHTAEPALATAP